MNIHKSTEEDEQFRNNLETILETGQYADACMICYEEGNKLKIPVHRVILAAKSKFFNAAFSTEMREAKTKEIEVPQKLGFSTNTIRTMLQFIYTTKLSIPFSENEDMLMALFKAAHFYQIDTLMNECIKLITFTNENCFSLLQLSDTYDNIALMKKGLNFLSENKNMLKNSDELSHIMNSQKSENISEKLKMLYGHWLGITSVTSENILQLLNFINIYGLNGNLEIVERIIELALTNNKVLKIMEDWFHTLSNPEQEELNALESHCYDYLSNLTLTPENGHKIIRLCDTFGVSCLWIKTFLYISNNDEAKKHAMTSEDINETLKELIQHESNTK